MNITERLVLGAKEERYLTNKSYEEVNAQFDASNVFCGAFNEKTTYAVVPKHSREMIDEKLESIKGVLERDVDVFVVRSKEITIELLMAVVEFTKCRTLVIDALGGGEPTVAWLRENALRYALRCFDSVTIRATGVYFFEEKQANEDYFKARGVLNLSYVSFIDGHFDVLKSFGDAIIYPKNTKCELCNALKLLRGHSEGRIDMGERVIVYSQKEKVVLDEYLQQEDAGRIVDVYVCTAHERAASIRLERRDVTVGKVLYLSPMKQLALHIPRLESITFLESIGVDFKLVIPENVVVDDTIRFGSVVSYSGFESMEVSVLVSGDYQLKARRMEAYCNSKADFWHKRLCNRKERGLKKDARDEIGLQIYGSGTSRVKLKELYVDGEFGCADIVGQIDNACVYAISGTWFPRQHADRKIDIKQLEILLACDGLSDITAGIKGIEQLKIWCLGGRANFGGLPMGEVHIWVDLANRFHDCTRIEWLVCDKLVLWGEGATLIPDAFLSDVQAKTIERNGAKSCLGILSDSTQEMVEACKPSVQLPYNEDEALELMTQSMDKQQWKNQLTLLGASFSGDTMVGFGQLTQLELIDGIKLNASKRNQSAFQESEIVKLTLLDTTLTSEAIQLFRNLSKMRSLKKIIIKDTGKPVKYFDAQLFDAIKQLLIKVRTSIEIEVERACMLDKEFYAAMRNRKGHLILHRVLGVPPVLGATKNDIFKITCLNEDNPVTNLIMSGKRVYKSRVLVTKDEIHVLIVPRSETTPEEIDIDALIRQKCSSIDGRVIVSIMEYKRSMLHLKIGQIAVDEIRIGSANNVTLCGEGRVPKVIYTASGGTLKPNKIVIDHLIFNSDLMTVDGGRIKRITTERDICGEQRITLANVSSEEVRGIKDVMLQGGVNIEKLVVESITTFRRNEFKNHIHYAEVRQVNAILSASEEIMTCVDEIHVNKQCRDEINVVQVKGIKADKLAIWSTGFSLFSLKVVEAKELHLNGGYWSLRSYMFNHVSCNKLYLKGLIREVCADFMTQSGLNLTGDDVVVQAYATGVGSNNGWLTQRRNAQKGVHGGMTLWRIEG